MATIAEKQAQLAEFRSRLARTEQERQETLAALESNRDTIPRIERSLARAQAAGDTAQVSFDTQNLESARRLTIELTDVLRREEEFIAELQDGIRILETEIRAAADQGPGTESAGATVAQDQQANADGADTQAPGPQSEIIDEDGIISDQPATSLPSNAVPAVTPLPEGVDAPGVLPPGQSFGRASDGSFRIDIEGVGSVPTPPIQIVVAPSNITAPDENTNLVSYIYRATRVISNFRQGKFTQELQGAQIFFTVPPRPSADKNRVPANTSTTEVTTNTPGTVRVGSVTDPGEIPGVTVSDREQTDPGEIPGVTTFGSSLASDTGAQAPLTSQPPTSGTTNVALPTQADVRRVDNAITAPQQGAREY